MTSELALLPNYADRLKYFEKVELRIESILLDYPDGLTPFELLDKYEERFRHKAEMPQRLRHLRSKGEVVSTFNPEKKRLVWRLSDKWKTNKK